MTRKQRILKLFEDNPSGLSFKQVENAEYQAQFQDIPGILRYYRSRYKAHSKYIENIKYRLSNPDVYDPRSEDDLLDDLKYHLGRARKWNYRIGYVHKYGKVPLEDKNIPYLDYHGLCRNAWAVIKQQLAAGILEREKVNGIFIIKRR